MRANRWDEEEVILIPPPPPEDVIKPAEFPPYNPPVAPTPPVDLTGAAPVEVGPLPPVIRDDITLIPAPTPAPPAPAPSVSPTPSFTPVSAKPRNGPQGWITTQDYPSADLRRGNEGTAQYRLTVGSNGRVNGCQITKSSGARGLDDATCRYVERRARFDPATNGEGRPVVGTYSGTVTWQIPD